MDNMAGAFKDYGYAGKYPWAEQVPGHFFAKAFGQDGNGPAHIAQVLLKQDQLYSCLAEKFYLFFSGLSWSSLTDSQRAMLFEKSKIGPAALVDGIISTY